jgi:hypothetical protein
MNRNTVTTIVVFNSVEVGTDPLSSFISLLQPFEYILSQHVIMMRSLRCETLLATAAAATPAETVACECCGKYGVKCEQLNERASVAEL